MEKHKKCKKVVRILDCKNYGRKIVCMPQMESVPINIPVISIIPTVKRYFYIAVANMNLANGATLPATVFYNDDGSQTEEFMSFSPNGYADLYINAVIQEGGMYIVNTSTLTIKPSNSIIYKGTPIILELLAFTANLS